MSRPEFTQSRMISRISALATILVLAILASSAYLRLTATQAPCLPTEVCATAQQEPNVEVTPDRRFARLAHRLSASTVAVLALLVVFITWTSQSPLLRHNRGLSMMLVALVLFLAVLGAITRSTYTPAVTLGNVLASNALAGIFWWLWLQTRRTASAPPVFTRKTRSLLPVAATCLAVIHIGIVAIGGVSIDSIGLMPLTASLSHNIIATVLFLATLWWLSRNLSAPD